MNEDPNEEFIARVRYPIAACMLVGVFLAFLYNRFLPAQDAWFANYGEMMNRGQVPYRDFYFFTQPLSLFVSQILVAIDDKLIMFRYYACLERLLMTAGTYWLLRQQFSHFASFAGTITSVILMTSFVIDPLHSYYYTCLLFCVLAMGCMAKAIGRKDETDYTLLVVSGVFVGLAFYAKQSLGAVMSIALFTSLALSSVSLGSFWRRFVRLGAGFSIAGLPFACWILFNGLSWLYFREVFLNAVGQKGGAFAILTGFLERITHPVHLFCFAVVAVVALSLVRTGLLSFRRSVTGEPGLGKAQFYSIFGLYLAAVVAPLLLWRHLGLNEFNLYLFVALQVTVALVFYGVVLLLVFILLRRRWMLAYEPACNPRLLTMVLGSFAVMYSVGMSFQIQEQALLPATGVCLAFIIDFFKFPRPYVMRYLIVLLSMLLILAGVTRKYLVTYWWYGWADSAVHVSSPVSTGKLAGFNIDPDEGDLYQKVVDIIHQNAKPEETVFTFPNCPMFNYLSDHPQPTFATVHYWDTCPDNIARGDQATLAKNPPRVIVWLRAPEDLLQNQEDSFRGGHRGGYNDLEDFLDKLTRNGGYKLALSKQYNALSFPLEVWVRQ